jgi:nitrogen fixation NifU-like protein
MNSMQDILDHYRDPEHFGVCDGHTHTCHSKNVSCGDEVTVYLKIENQKVVDFSFEGKGCAISVAAMSMLSDEIIGMHVNDIQKITPDFVVDLLGIEIGPVRLKCALIGLDATKKAIVEN